MERQLKKRRKYSKKSKKNLRKYTDIHDVEEFLEEQRFQERTGGLVCEKKDEQLFFVQNKSEGDEIRTPKSLRRKRPLRSHANLHRDPIVSHQQTTSEGSEKSVQERRTVEKLRSLLGGVSDSSDDEQDYDVSSRFAVKRQRQELELAKAVCERLKKSRIKPVTKDLWAESGDVVSRKDVPDEHFLRVTRKLPVKKPKSVGARTSSLASVPPPPPGASYNPAFDDHQELLQSAVDVEETRFGADQKLNRRLEMMEPMSAAQREQVWQDEMIEGLIEGQGEEEGEEGEESDGVLLNKRPVLAANKKTLQQRRREQERKMKVRQRLAAKMLKTRMNDVYRLRSLKRELVKREGAVSKKEGLRHQSMEKEAHSTKRLGRVPYMDPDIDVQLSSEISGALRTLKCEGNVALDRYKSLQKRNIIEPRQRVRPHRKYKLKYKEKRSARLPEDVETANR